MVIKTGSPMFEVLNYYLEGIKKSDILEKLKISEGKYFVVSAHREENIDSDKNFAKLIDIINTIAEVFKFPVIISTHPVNSKKSMYLMPLLIRWFNF